MYGNRHGGVRSAAVAEACNSRGSKVGWDVLGWYPHLVSEKTGKQRSCRRDPYLEINIADLRKVFACTVTYIYIYIYIYKYIRNGGRDRTRTPKSLLCSWLPRLSRNMESSCLLQVLQVRVRIIVSSTAQYYREVIARTW